MLMRQSCVLPVLAQNLQKRAYEAGYDATPISAGLTDSKLSCVVDTVTTKILEKETYILYVPG